MLLQISHNVRLFKLSRTGVTKLEGFDNKLYLPMNVNNFSKTKGSRNLSEMYKLYFYLLIIE